jgi:hypothetical protein
MNILPLCMPGDHMHLWPYMEEGQSYMCARAFEFACHCVRKRVLVRAFLGEVIPCYGVPLSRRSLRHAPLC